MILGMAGVSLLVALYGIMAERLGRWSISTPMVIMASGHLLGPSVTGAPPVSPQIETVMRLAEPAEP